MEEKQGYLPGNNYDKTAPYIQPLKDALLTLNINPDYAIKDPNNVSIIKENKAFIDFMPHTYLRGTNFENQVVIIDEAQNFYFDELKKTLTRIHDNCKVILIGHTEQCDLYKKPQNTGFKPYWNAFANCDDSRVKVCELTINHRGWLSTFCDDVGNVREKDMSCSRPIGEMVFAECNQSEKTMKNSFYQDSNLDPNIIPV
jgi:predicted ribonuclease YlaK